MVSFFRIILINLIFIHLSFGQEYMPPISDSFDEYKKLKENTEFGLDWVTLGPTLNSARVESVQVDPNNPATMYVAFGSGNLWKTVDHGLTWKPIFENQAVQGIGDIAIAPSDPNIIYVGTGESLKKPRNFTMPGNGVYKSVNGGATWTHLGLEDSWHIGEITIHPKDPDIVYVAILGHFWSANENRGVFRTLDGGENWEKVLYIDEKTGANDIVVAPSDPNVIYASMWENYPDVMGKNSGVYKSVDAGANWTLCSVGFPQSDSTGRIGIAVSHQDPEKVYAFLDNRRVEPSGEIYKSENGGNSWKKTHEKDLPILSRIGWYFVDMYVNPQNDEEIFGLGVRIAHSKNGGKDFDLIGGDVFHLFPSDADDLHLDHCEMWINPNNPNHLVVGNDGGVYVSYNKGGTWMHYNNLPTGEYYDISIDTQEPYNIYGGTQDDATVYGPAREWNPKFSDSWKYLWVDSWSGGDGCVTQIDPEDSNTVYFSAQEGAIRRRNMKSGKSIPIRPKFEKGSDKELQYNFINPYFISPHDSKTLYHAGNYVFKTKNRGDDWFCISPDLSQSKFEEKNALSAGAMEESPLMKGQLYLGTDKGGFWYSPDDGNHWEERSEGLPNAYIRSIAPSRFSDSTVYMTLSGINYDDFENHLYFSQNNGKQWSKIKANLPNEVAYVIKEDPIHEGVLYLGMYRGVYVSVDNGITWSILGRNLPAVAVADLEIEPKTHDLISATHGRGIYKMNLTPLYESLKEDFKASDDHLFDTDSIKAPWLNDTHRDPDYNTAGKLPISFWSSKTQTVEILISNDKEMIWSTSFNAQYGLNQFRWDLISKKTNSLNPYHIHYDVFINPGGYTLSLKTPNGIYTKELKVGKGEKPID